MACAGGLQGDGTPLRVGPCKPRVTSKGPLCRVVRTLLSVRSRNGCAPCLMLMQAPWLVGADPSVGGGQWDQPRDDAVGADFQHADVPAHGLNSQLPAVGPDPPVGDTLESRARLTVAFQAAPRADGSG